MARENGKKGGRPRKDKTITAGGDTREGSQGTRTAAAITRNEPLENDPLDTSANIYGPRQAKNGGSGTSQDRQSRRTDGHSLSKGNSSSSPSVRPSLAYAGRGGNVHLTDDEYAMLLQEIGNKRKADKLIDSLDYAISEGKTFNAPHFHVLMHWNDYREEKAEERAKDMKVKAEAFAEASKKQGLKSNADKMDEMMAGAKHIIDMYSLPEVKNG